MKGKTLLCLALVTSMLLSVFMIGPVGAQSTTIGVEPPSIVDLGLVPGSNFTVNITIRDVTNLAASEFKLRYNTTVLTATLIEYGGIFGPTHMHLGSGINDAEGWLRYADMEMPGEPSFTGSGVLATITFNATGLGGTTLDLYDTKLGATPDPTDPLTPVPISHVALDGYFRNALAPLVHDVAITNVVSSPTEVTVGENVAINVTVKNKGNFNETFDVTVYYDNTAIDTETLSLENGTSTTLTFTWDTTDIAKGTYTIKAEAILDLDNDTDDNTGEAEDPVTVREAAPASNILIYGAVAAAAIAIIAAAIYIVKIRKRV